MDKPNFIWIYCDELRADALGCYGNRYAKLETPHIDSIADSGIRFDSCFCNSPVCVPSRTSVLSGLHPEDTGVYHNEGFWSQFRLDKLPNLIPEVFADHGYVTANFGKIHIPHQLQPWMYSEPGRIGSGFAPKRDQALSAFRSPGIPAHVGGRYPANVPYPPEQNTDNALKWLAQAEEPYFVRISYLQPHTPVFPPPPYDTLYLDAKFPKRFKENVNASLFERHFADVVRGKEMSSQEIFLAQVYYYGLVAWLDAQVGRILNFLRETGKLEKTVLMFGADHGASLGEGGGRYQKHIYAPEVHRVPLLISWPGTIPSSQVRTEISECLDCGRTLFSLAGIRAPDQFKGRDLLSTAPPEAVYATIGFGFPDSRIFPNLGVGEYADGHGWPGGRAYARPTIGSTRTSAWMVSLPTDRRKTSFLPMSRQIQMNRTTWLVIPHIEMWSACSPACWTSMCRRALKYRTSMSRETRFFDKSLAKNRGRGPGRGTRSRPPLPHVLATLF